MFASRAINTDPFPYVGEHGSRHAYAGTLNQKPLTFSPRPEYDNNPNLVLVTFRYNDDTRDPVEWLAYSEGAFIGPLAHLEHARKVLTRLAALEGN